MDPELFEPVTMIPEGWTTYDKVVVNEGSLTVQAFINWFETNMGVKVSIITCGVAYLYRPLRKFASRLERPIEDIYPEVTKLEIQPGQTYLKLVLSCSKIEDDRTVVMPVIKYIFA